MQKLDRHRYNAYTLTHINVHIRCAAKRISREKRYKINNTTKKNTHFNHKSNAFENGKEQNR